MEISKKDLKDKRKEEAAEIQKMECRMYEKKFPSIDDLVMVRKLNDIILVFNQNNL